MKKVFALLMMLAMVMVCGSAVAVTVTGGTEGTDWHFSTDRKTLYINKEGTYTVSGWDDGKKIYIDPNEGTVNLTLNNVHLSNDTNDYGIVWQVGVDNKQDSRDVVLNLTMIDSSINTNDNALCIMRNSDGKNVNMYLTVTGSNALLNSTGRYAIRMYKNGQVNGDTKLTLGGTMTLKGSYTAVDLSVNGDPEFYIDGTVLPGIHAEVSDNMDGSSPMQLNNGKPFSEKTPYEPNWIDDYEFLRLYKPEAPAVPDDLPQTGSLPQTGDSSSLALWLCLLAFAGAGMTAMRKREA